MSAAPQWVYFFGDGASEGDPARADLLGGKGASLAALSRAGFPVPPGFTISAECCAYAEAHDGRWPDGLEAQVRAALSRLEGATGRKFGRGPMPLLVAVRSGAGVSMPGMMDTILNCGLTLECGDPAPLSPDFPLFARGDSTQSPKVPSPAVFDTATATGRRGSSASHVRFWNDYAEHIRMFAASVAGLKLADGQECSPNESAGAETEPERNGGKSGESGARSPHSKELLARLWLAEYERRTGHPFPTDPWDSLVQCINAVFASWHSERARAYRQHHGITGLPGTAVNVQSMFPSERSGVLFTTNPQQPDADEMILEASWGLGEAVVSGAVTPDIYVIDRESLAVRSVSPGDRPEGRPALTDDEAIELARLGMRVERHFGVPSDIEWGIAGGRIALLQTRPIRGLDALRAIESYRRSEIERLRTVAGPKRIVWVAHNLGETLPLPTPLTWDIVRWFMSGDGGFGRLYRMLEFRPSREVCERGFLELICGRIYVDPVRAAGLFWGSLPFEYDAETILADRQALERPPTKLNLEEADPFLFLRLPGLLWSMWRSSRTMRRLRTLECVPLECGALSPLCEDDSPGDLDSTEMQQGAPSTSSTSIAHSPPQSGDKAPHSKGFARTALPALESFLRGCEAVRLDSLATGELLAELDRRIEFVLGDFAAQSLLPGYFGGIAREELQRWLVQILGPERGEEMTGWLTTGLEGDITVRQNVRLYEAARTSDNGDPTAAFLKEFGHRAVDEMELAQPRWTEDSSFVDRMMAEFRKERGDSPAERHAAQVAARMAAEAELPRLLEENGASSLRERIEKLIVEAQTLLPYRETGKYHLMRGYATIRAAIVELGRRWNLGGDVFYLRREELPRFESQADELRSAAARRKAEWQAAKKLSPAESIDSRDLDGLGRPPRREASGGGRHTARPIAPGHARGPARIVRSPSEATDLGTGYILVCPSTDPGWTPLFLRCKGLIVERGGVLSHGAIVARDFGIPAVVLERATLTIPDGATVEIDAHHGMVTISQPDSQPLGSGV